MAVGDIFARLFSAGGTRGLSGDLDLVLQASPDLEFFNDGLRLHRTDVDVVAEPQALWDTGAFLARKGGLEAHLQADRGDGLANFTDVLVILSQDDWRRTLKARREPWVDTASRALGDKLAAYSQLQDLHFIFPQRTPRFTFIQDGGPDTGGVGLGLDKGEFVTGLLANCYGGAQPTSRPMVAVHLHLPGVWEGYREVGRLYNDQILFTLGSHWLDSFTHPALQRPALYRLQHFADGSFVHIINPDVQEMYQIRTEQAQGGPSVVTIEDLLGDPVAHVVLAVVETVEYDPGPQRMGLALMADITADHPVPRKEPANLAASPDSAPGLAAGSKTVMPLEVDERLLTLRERGALLQKVHFGNFMQGYDVYLGPRGEVTTTMAEPMAIVQVRSDGVTIVAQAEGVRVGGSALRKGRSRTLKGESTLHVGDQAFEYRDLSDTRAEGWPYLGELRRIGGTVRMVFGEKYRIGRDRRCKVRLPDEPYNGNIIWRPEVGDGATIRSRTGNIPKSRFYTDSIMVASEHAEVDLGTEPVLHSTARHCFTYVRRGHDVFALAPTRSRSGGSSNMDLVPGDEILIGNCVFEVAYPPSAGPRSQLASERRGRHPLSAAELAAAADVETANDEGLPRSSKAPGVEDPPSAAGLGERGLPPPRPEITMDALDSVLGAEAPEAPEIRLSDRDTAPPRDAAPPRGVIPPPMMLGDEVVEPPLASAVHTIDVPLDDVPPRPVGSKPKTPVIDSAVKTVDVPIEGLAPRPVQLPPEAAAKEDPTDIPAGPPPPLPLARAPDSILGVADDEDDNGHWSGRDWSEAVPDPSVTLPPMPGWKPDQQPGGAAGDPEEAEEAEEPEVAEVAPDAEEGEPAEETFELAPPAEEAELSLDADVIEIDELGTQLELSRPCRLVLAGWMIKNTIRVGNHTDALVGIPENRVSKRQQFTIRDYAEIYVRGRKVSVSSLDATETRILLHGEEVARAQTDEGLELRVLRRDDAGREDFEVSLRFEEEPGLPDPRARLLAPDLEEPLTAALFTRGLPLGAPRPVALGPVAMTALFDGEQVQLKDYLTGYRKEDGSFTPFFVSHGGAAFQTMPEDGRTVALAPGDRVIAGQVLYRVVT